MAVSQHVIAWVCGPQVLNEYLLRVFYAMKQELERYTFGATIATIGMDDVGKLVTPVPPVIEQRAIAAKVAADTDTLNRFLEQTERTVRALREFRTRLIADVVTGKLDVREAATRLPAESEDYAPPDDVEGDLEATDIGDDEEVPGEAEA